MTNSHFINHPPEQADAPPSDLVSLVEGTGEELFIEEQEDIARRFDRSEPIDLFDKDLTGRPVLSSDAFPEVLLDYAQDTAERIGFNPEAIAVPCLAAISAAIREGWQVQPKPNDPTWREKPIIWVGLTGPTGNTKTAACKAAMDPLKAKEKAWFKTDEVEVKRYESDKRIWDKKTREWENWMANPARDPVRDPGPEPTRVAYRRLFVEDINVETLMVIANENPSGVLVFRDELTAWLGSFGVYGNAGPARDRAIFLSGYNGDSAHVDRLSKKIRARSFACSILGGIQDDLVRTHLAKGPADGLLARFIFARADRRMGLDRAPNFGLLKAYRDAVETLCELKPAGWHPEDNPDAGVIVFSEEAAAIHQQVVMFRHRLQDLPHVASSLRDHLSKWDGLFARLALIFHMFDAAVRRIGPSDRISGETAEKVRTFMLNYLLPEAVDVHHRLLVPDEHTEHARWIAGYILARRDALKAGKSGYREITLHDIGRAYRALRGDEEGIRRAMTALELGSWVHPLTPSPGQRRRRWAINPRVWERFAALAESERKRRDEAMREAQITARLLRRCGAE